MYLFRKLRKGQIYWLNEKPPAGSVYLQASQSEM